MRTTVTLDPDVAAKLRAEARARDISFKEALNEAVRRGLRDDARPTVPYAVPARRMEVRPGIDLDKALRLASEIEDEEIVRELNARR